MSEPSGRDGPENRRSSLAVAPRVAAIALVIQALLQRCAGSTTSLSMPLRTAIYLSIVALGVAQLVRLSIIALRVRPRWAIAGLLAWTVGWLSITLDVSSLVRWSLGGPFPIRLSDAQVRADATTCDEFVTREPGPLPYRNQLRPATRIAALPRRRVPGDAATVRASSLRLSSLEAAS
jgi:hypothetical protein